VRIGNQKDFWSGILFQVLGIGFVLLAQEYKMGTAQRMGPGYFPTLLGGLLAVLGIVIAIQGLRSNSAAGDIERLHFRQLVIVLGAVVLFGALLRPAGLVIALLVLISLSAYASHEFRLREVLPLAALLVLMVLAVFIWGLGLVIPLWPAFLAR